LLGLVRPTAGPVEQHFVAAILTLAIGQAAEWLELSPRIFFLSLRAWGILLIVFGAAMFGGPAVGALAVVAVAVGGVVSMRMTEAKQRLGAVAAFAEYRKISDTSTPLRSVLLFDALFSNFWIRADLALVRHTCEVLEQLLRDRSVALEIHQRDTVERLQRNLLGLQASGTIPWFLPGTRVLRRHLARLAG
jgi:hypothetical protein